MTRKHVAVGVGLGLLALAIFLSSPTTFGLCIPYVTQGGTFCSAPWHHPYGVWLSPLSASFLLMAIVMFIATRATFRRWIKFSIGYGIVAALLLFAMPEFGVGVGGFGLTYVNTEMFADFYAILYAIISFFLLGISEFLERRHSKKM